jgi:tRNA (guanine-N7-)-methyltransferase
MTNDSQQFPEFRLYGRSQGKALSKRQQDLIDDFMPTIDLPSKGDIDPSALNPEKVAQILEIGFGGGEHLAGQAAHHPDIGYIGIEPYLNGVAKALTYVEGQNLTNVRIHRGDARETLRRIIDGCFDRVFLMFPDPWPKIRQHKRRFVNEQTRDHFARILKSGGKLRIATDVKSYADHVMIEMGMDDRFEWVANKADDWRMAPDDHITTRYEEKKLGDCAPVWMDFVRL